MVRRHYFTLEEANNLVAWLTQKFESLQPLNQKLQESSALLEGLMRKVRANGASNIEKSIADTQKEVESIGRQMGHVIEEISQKGIIVRDPRIGLVDFPALREGREVHLCWRLGEGRIGFWHETTTGYASRQPL